MKRLLIAAAAAALFVIPATADAAKTKKIAGVTYFSDNVWSNQLDFGEPVVSFPLGCAAPGEQPGPECDYTIRLEFLPEGSPSCSSTETAGRACDVANDACMARVGFLGITPMRSFHGRPDNGRVDNEDIEDFRPDSGGLFIGGHQIFSTWAFASINSDIGLGRSLVLTSSSTESFVGRNYEMLTIRSWELEMTPNGLCRLGIDVLYHPNSKGVYEQGRLLP